MMTGHARGSSIRKSLCLALIPIPCADSAIAGSTERKPATVLRKIGSSPYMTSATTVGG
jgi:hypothetical protein